MSKLRSRVLSRDTALCLLYEWEITRTISVNGIADENTAVDLETDLYDVNPTLYTITKLLERDEDELELDYIQTVVDGVKRHIREIDELIAANLQKWSIRRLAKVDLSIMRLSVFEMLYIKHIASAVSIDAAVDLSKVYSTEKAGPIINGVLGTIARKLTADARAADEED